MLQEDNRARLAALLLTVPLALAGCLGSDDGGAEATETASADAADTADTAGAADAAATTPATPAAEETPAAPPAPVTIPVAWDGKVAGEAGAWAMLPTGTGYGGGVEVEKGNQMYAPELPGLPLSGTATLTWMPSTPVTETLVFGAMTMRDGSEGMEHPFLVTVDGKSPLTLELSGIEAQPGDMFHLFVHAQAQEAGPAMIYATPAQDFTVEGSLLVQVGGPAMGGGHQGH